MSDALRMAAAKLKSANVAEGMRDARKILKHLLGSSLFDNDLVLTGWQLSEFEQKIERRCRFQPVAQIIGEREFWGRSFIVNSHVLDPRPETELLVEIATAGIPPTRMLDLGTGSGAIAISLLKHWPNSSAVAVDISTKALEVARRNAFRHAVEQRLELLQSDWLAKVVGTFDLIVSNPPYISDGEMAGLAPEIRLWEPRLALTPGADGFAVYRLISDQLTNYLSSGGCALFEVGKDQAEVAAGMLRATNLGEVSIYHDLNGHQRVVGLTRAS